MNVEGRMEHGVQCESHISDSSTIAVKLGIVAVGLAAVAGGNDETEAQEPRAVTVEAGEEEPREFYGKTVTLVGETEEVYNDRSFVLAGNDCQRLMSSPSESFSPSISSEAW